jgi:hypothetical protein
LRDVLEYGGRSGDILDDGRDHVGPGLRVAVVYLIEVPDRHASWLGTIVVTLYGTPRSAWSHVVSRILDAACHAFAEGQGGLPSIALSEQR